MLDDDDASTNLRERVFFAARDGMSLTLYALLYEKNTDDIDDVLNSVSIKVKQNILFILIILGVIFFTTKSRYIVYFYRTNQSVRCLLRVTRYRVLYLLLFVRRAMSLRRYDRFYSEINCSTYFDAYFRYLFLKFSHKNYLNIRIKITEE